MDLARTRPAPPADVTAADGAGAHGPEVRHRPVLVELMGPATAGKTSLARALRSREGRVAAGVRVPRRIWFPRLVLRLAGLVPIWLRARPRGRWFTWNEMKSIAFLDSWLRAVQRGTWSASPLVVLDHGPIYRLARLREFGPPLARSERFGRWWRTMLDGWAHALDLIVSLDAPDEVLLGRVERRGHWYLSSEPSVEQQRAFLERYRRAFAEVLEMAGDAAPALLPVRSDQRAPEQIAQQVLAVTGRIEGRSAR
ncbi:MAG TPA: hypothetical protein VE646_10820 [Actinomycetota bacterium]|jgi:hypothetical protein|nr:hypothetical protein [Actinomycetota bacterium]